MHSSFDHVSAERRKGKDDGIGIGNVKTSTKRIDFASIESSYVIIYPLPVGQNARKKQVVANSIETHHHHATCFSSKSFGSCASLMISSLFGGTGMCDTCLKRPSGIVLKPLRSLYLSIEHSLLSRSAALAGCVSVCGALSCNFHLPPFQMP